VAARPYSNPVSERLSKLPWVEISILVLAIVLRTIWLDLKPAHFDEGINGWFADQMRINGFYHYDPTNYHGPLHFYLVFLSQTLFGRNLWALRLPAIIASVLAVWALLRYREFFGPTVSRIAATAMAVSPAYVFYGRYSIHESGMVFFSILALWGVLGLWEKGERRHLIALVVALTGMILTKETYVLHAGCLLLAGGGLWIWQKIVPSRPAMPWARQLWTGKDLAAACGLGLLAIVFFYSGTFLDWAGLKGLYQTFAAWFHTGVEAGGHEKTAYELWGQGTLNYYWLMLMGRYEWPALAGFLLCLPLIGRSEARLRYIAILAGGVLMAYSLIPYKTPWCIISILWPFYLILGSSLRTRVDGQKNPWDLALVGLLLAVSLGMSLRLNFLHFTDEKEPYVYVQTYPEIETLTGPLLEMAKRDPRTRQLRGQILLESYYPLPWILGDFTQIGYYSDKEPPKVFDGDFIVVAKSKADELEAGLDGSYVKRTFRLRDAMGECVVFFRVPPFALLPGESLQPISSPPLPVAP
jgi:uncharacterized protein (TIGR03663 family)